MRFIAMLIALCFSASPCFAQQSTKMVAFDQTSTLYRKLIGIGEERTVQKAFQLSSTGMVSRTSQIVFRSVDHQTVSLTTAIDGGILQVIADDNGIIEFRTCALQGFVTTESCRFIVRISADDGVADDSNWALHPAAVHTVRLNPKDDDVLLTKEVFDSIVEEYEFKTR
jgi:hypothetical protein